MDYVLGAILIVVTVAFVMYPLRKGRGIPLEESAAPLEASLSNGAANSSLLDELEVDLAIGNLSQQDYAKLKARYQGEGKSLDVLPEADADLGDEIEAAVRKLRGGKILFCPECGTRRRSADRFCGQCGGSFGDDS